MSDLVNSRGESLSPKPKKMKPCPFCGDVNLKLIQTTTPKNESLFRVSCFICYCGGPFADNERAAVTRWNMRAKSLTGNR